MTTVYGIANCDTVKKARALLAERGVAYRFHDFRKDGLPPDRLDAWLGSAGVQKLLNRQGLTWRRLDASDQARAAEAAGARALLLEQPTLVKRPVIEWDDGRITVGLDPVNWPR